VRDSVFPFIVQETGREPAKLEIEVQVLVKGPFSYLEGLSTWLFGKHSENAQRSTFNVQRSMIGKLIKRLYLSVES